jgi:hypothetical protein
VLGGAGIAAGAVAATVVVGTTPAGADATGIATGLPGTIALEIVAQIAQNGAELVAGGYVSGGAGLGDNDLFSDPSNHSELTSLMTVSAAGEVVARAVNNGVFVLDVHGTLDVFQRQAPGASFDDLASFAQGNKLASFDLVLQDVLTVIAPNTGIPTLAGLATQNVGPRSSRFGRPGQRLRLEATGLGTRSDATAPTAALSIAGNLTVV